jgi:hypothetical protein
MGAPQNHPEHRGEQNQPCSYRDRNLANVHRSFAVIWIDVQRRNVYNILD